MSRYPLLQLGLVCNLFFVLHASDTLRAETDAETANKIRHAWSERRDSIKTFQYVCALEENKNVVHGPTDPFGKSERPASPILDETLRSTMTFSFDKGKLAFRHEGQQWSEIKRAISPDYLFCAAFDGTGNRTLLKDVGWTGGTFDRRREPGRQVTVGLYQIAIWLTFDPVSHFQRTDYDCDKMRIVQRDIMSEGRKCIEVNLPRSHSKQWLGRLILDPSRSYLPVKFAQEFDGVTYSDVILEFAKNDNLGWVVSGWTQRQLDSQTKSFNKLNVSVIKSALNTELKKDVFDVPFPVGTHVVEETDKGKRYYTQEADGKLKPIKEREYGHISPGKTL